MSIKRDFAKYIFIIQLLTPSLHFHLFIEKPREFIDIFRNSLRPEGLGRSAARTELPACARAAYAVECGVITLSLRLFKITIPSALLRTDLLGSSFPDEAKIVPPRPATIPRFASHPATLIAGNCVSAFHPWAVQDYSPLEGQSRLMRSIATEEGAIAIACRYGFARHAGMV